MLMVYSHWKYFNSFSAGTVFTRHNLQTSDSDVQIRSPHLKGYRINYVITHRELENEPGVSCMYNDLHMYDDLTYGISIIISQKVIAKFY